MNARHVLLQRGNKRAWIYPEQGFQLHGFEQEMGERGVARVIYAPGTMTEPFDRRYGNPVLFPSPSRSQSGAGPDTWKWNGRTLPMPFHGFARDVYWQVTDVQMDRVTARLVPEGVSRVCFPFNFALRLTYRLGEDGLALDAEISNTGDAEAFPYALGFHPYIRVPLGPRGAITDASVVLPGGAQIRSDDGGRTHGRQPLEPRRVQADAELVNSLLLTDLPTRCLEVEDRANGMAARVSVEESEGPFPYWVIWSASPDSAYVCLEPWTDTPNALNRPSTRRCAPGETHRYRMVLSVRETD
jgi:galactose mutarotase-like enzyme